MTAFPGARRRQRGGLGVVEIQHRDFGPGHEVAEQRAQLFHRLVVERDVVHHRDGGRVERDGAVALVDFADEGAARADHGAGERRVSALAKFFISAPFMMVGSSPARAEIQPIMAVVVDLPLVPATPTLVAGRVEQLRQQLGAGHDLGRRPAGRRRRRDGLLDRGGDHGHGRRR